MEIATIGFTQSSAEHFFERLKAARVERVLDIRLHNTSQLAGFAKGSDLAYLVPAIVSATYEHDVSLAPTEDLLSEYRATKDWDAYEPAFLRLMEERGVPGVVDRASFERKTALLCSEPAPERCHRRLVAEILSRAWGASVEHL
jgi:uncharacterized protein (DUF488 family)